MTSTTVRYQYTGGTGTWTNYANAFDGVDDTYAYTGSYDAYLLGTELPTITPLGAITKVEIGGEGYCALSGSKSTVQPLFNGSTAGSSYLLSAWETTDIDTPIYADVTSDSAGPGSSNWSWSDIQNLDVKLWGGDNKSLNTPRVDALYIRVTYVVSTNIPSISIIDEKPPLGAVSEIIHPMMQDCRAFLLLNENAGGLIVDSVSGDSGNLSDATQWEKRPGWLHFDGSATSVTLPMPKNNVFPVMTLLLQVRIDSLSSSTGGLWQLNDASNARMGYIRIMADGSIRVVFNADGSLAIQTGNVLSAGVDYFLAISFNGNSAASGIRIFINGTETSYASTSDGTPSSSADTWNLGVAQPSSGTYDYFPGSIRWVAWFNRVLTPSEINDFGYRPFEPFASTIRLADSCSAAVTAYHLTQLCAT
jgi:hypothetical protein